MLSPMLLHNLCPHGCRQLVLRVSPYGTRDPGVPTAKSITLARVASPFSVHRRYEPLFIDALHEYFGSSKRLVKGGDIIPLRINVDRSLDPHHTLRPGDFTRNVTHNCSDVPVYFVVRNVDYETVAVQTHGQPFSVSHIGCFVDANVTKIIQVGVEQIRVPDIYDYYELCWVSFRLFLLLALTFLSGHARVALPAAFGISHQISQLSNAMSLDEAASFGVRSTVFITGSRGTGKFSAAVHIARHLQMHFVEVSSRLSTWVLVNMIVLQINCFDVLSDTTAKTEVALLEQVESAISSSPCLVVLRHADALSHSVTTVDGKEGLFRYLFTYLPCIHFLHSRVIHLSNITAVY